MLSLVFLLACSEGSSESVDSGDWTDPAMLDQDGDGWSEWEGDCDDGDPDAYPGADEICDGRDQDCDGDIDELLELPWYIDNDGDGYGDANEVIEDCSQPSGTVEDNTDCDDTDPSVHPGADEWCDGLDQDCDGVPDEGFEDDLRSFFEDSDGDSWGDPESQVLLCDGPDEDWVRRGEDCDDSDPEIHPDAHEACDGLDNNCDGDVWGCSSLSSDADSVLLGERASDLAGMAIVGPGDWTGDGIPDLVFSAPLHEPGPGISGAVLVFAGPVAAGEHSIVTADLVIPGAHQQDRVGDSMSAPGDVNGDGFQDLLVSGRSVGSDWVGRAMLLLGPLDGTSTLVEPDAVLEFSQYTGQMGAVGDLDGDGYAEIAVGAPSGTSEDPDVDAVWVFRGPLSGVVDLNDAVAHWENSKNWDLGSDIQGIGDVNGDGLGDLAVGVPGDGLTAIFQGPLSGFATRLVDADTHLRSGGENTSAGFSLAGPGDLNGDGLDDLVVGDPNAVIDLVRYAGAAAVFTDLSPDEVWFSGGHMVLEGARESGYLGYDVAPAGDVDGDGQPDWLVSAYLDDSTGPLAGTVFLLRHLESGVHRIDEVADATWLGEGLALNAAGLGDSLGTSMAGLGDLDGDGFDDFALGAPASDTSGQADSGKVILVAGGVGL
jgi:hypothetical protein